MSENHETRFIEPDPINKNHVREKDLIAEIRSF